MDYEVKTATEERFPDVLRAVDYVFGDEVSNEEIERVRRLFDMDRVIYIQDREDIVAGGGAYTLRSTVPGNVLPTAGVTLIAVKPSHRRKGLLRAMMQHQFNDIHERGEPIATLWASEGAIYGRFGYGLASVQAWIDIEKDRGMFIDDPGPSGRYRMLPLEGAIKTVAPIYERVQARTPGMFERTKTWWESKQFYDTKAWREGASGKYLAIWENDAGEPRAYAIYRIETGWSHAGPTGNAQVWEVIADDVTATREMWRFMFGIDLVDRVKSKIPVLPVDTPLLLMLQEARRLRADLTDGLWLRVVDVKGALEGRGYAADGEIVIEIHDDMCPWNEGRWSLAARDGRAEVRRTEREPGLVMNAAGLGTAYLGTFSFAELARAGRIKVVSNEARETADALIRTDIAPYCPEIF